MPTWIDAISTVGFPIVVCLYFMYKTERVIENNTKAMIRMGIIAKKCKK